MPRDRKQPGRKTRVTRRTTKKRSTPKVSPDPNEATAAPPDPTTEVEEPKSDNLTHEDQGKAAERPDAGFSSEDAQNAEASAETEENIGTSTTEATPPERHQVGDLLMAKDGSMHYLITGITPEGVSYTFSTTPSGFTGRTDEELQKGSVTKGFDDLPDWIKKGSLK